MFGHQGLYWLIAHATFRACHLLLGGHYRAQSSVQPRVRTCQHGPEPVAVARLGTVLEAFKCVEEEHDARCSNLRYAFQPGITYAVTRVMINLSKYPGLLHRNRLLPTADIILRLHNMDRHAPPVAIGQDLVASRPVFFVRCSEDVPVQPTVLQDAIEQVFEVVTVRRVFKADKAVRYVVTPAAIHLQPANQQGLAVTREPVESQQPVRRPHIP